MGKTDNTRPAKFGGRECFVREADGMRFKPARKSFKPDQAKANRKQRREARAALAHDHEPDVSTEQGRGSVHWDYW